MTVGDDRQWPSGQAARSCHARRAVDAELVVDRIGTFSLKGAMVTSYQTSGGGDSDPELIEQWGLAAASASFERETK